MNRFMAVMLLACVPAAAKDTRHLRHFTLDEEAIGQIFVGRGGISTMLVLPRAEEVKTATGDTAGWSIQCLNNLCHIRPDLSTKDIGNLNIVAVSGHTYSFELVPVKKADADFKVYVDRVAIASPAPSKPDVPMVPQADFEALKAQSAADQAYVNRELEDAKALLALRIDPVTVRADYKVHGGLFSKPEVEMYRGKSATFVRLPKGKSNAMFYADKDEHIDASCTDGFCVVPVVLNKGYLKLGIAGKKVTFERKGHA